MPGMEKMRMMTSRITGMMRRKRSQLELQ